MPLFELEAIDLVRVTQDHASFRGAVVVHSVSESELLVFVDFVLEIVDGLRLLVQFRISKTLDVLVCFCGAVREPDLLVILDTMRRLPPNTTEEPIFLQPDVVECLSSVASLLRVAVVIVGRAIHAAVFAVDSLIRHLVK